MNRKIVLGGVIVIAAVGLTASQVGIFVGSERVTEPWVVNSDEVEGEVLVCRYLRLGSGIIETRFWQAERGTVIYLPDGGGSHTQVAPEAVGGDYCVWYL